MTPMHIKKRVEFARWWRKNQTQLLKKNKFIMFSDEKQFTVNGGLNRQNSRVYAKSRSVADKNGGIIYSKNSKIKFNLN